MSSKRKDHPTPNGGTARVKGENKAAAIILHWFRRTSAARTTAIASNYVSIGVPRPHPPYLDMVKSVYKVIPTATAPFYTSKP
jgi:hypothetical protein